MTEPTAALTGAVLADKIAAARPSAQVGLIDLYKLPPASEIGSEPIAEAASEHAAARKALSEAKRELEALSTKGRAIAESEDARAYADALAKDPAAKSPGNKAVAAFERTYADRKHRADALALIEKDRLRDLDHAFREHADDWLEAVNDAEFNVCREFERHMSDAAELVGRVQVVRALRAFLNGRRYNPNATAQFLDGADKRPVVEMLHTLLMAFEGDEGQAGRKPPETVAEAFGRSMETARETWRS